MPYIAFLRDETSHSNAADSHPGWGKTKEEAVANSLYWANQQPWVEVVPASRAPRWAQAAAWDARRHELELKETTGEPKPLTDAEAAELQSYRDTEIYA